MKTGNKHSAIIRAATKVFAKKGFFNARISDIAKEAKVADGTIYLYFDNKHDILISVFEEEIGKIHQKSSALINSTTNPEEKLHIFISNHLKAMKNNKYLAEVIQRELRQAEKKIKEYRNSKFLDYINLISDIISQGKQAGVFRKDIQNDIVKRLIFGALDEISRVWDSSLETNYSIDETIEECVNLLCTGLGSSSNNPPNH